MYPEVTPCRVHFASTIQPCSVSTIGSTGSRKRRTSVRHCVSVFSFPASCSQPDIRMDWETYNIDPNDRKLVDVLVAYGDAFPVKDADGNEMLSGAIRPFHRTIQTVLGRTDTPGSEGMSASLQSLAVSIIMSQRTPIHKCVIMFNSVQYLYHYLACGTFLWL